jgi:hypothetical protein
VNLPLPPLYERGGILMANKRLPFLAISNIFPIKPLKATHHKKALFCKEELGRLIFDKLE